MFKKQVCGQIKTYLQLSLHESIHYLGSVVDSSVGRAYSSCKQGVPGYSPGLVSLQLYICICGGMCRGTNKVAIL